MPVEYTFLVHPGTGMTKSLKPRNGETVHRIRIDVQVQNGGATTLSKRVKLKQNVSPHHEMLKVTWRHN